MIAVIDSSVLIDLFDKRIVGDHRAKLDALFRELNAKHATILVPTPALTEIMVWAGEARGPYMQILSKNKVFQLAPFDGRAAMECASLLEDAFTKNERKQITKTKFKFDWQITAIALSRGADILYSEDGDLERCSAKVGLTFQKPSLLPVPEHARQRMLELVHPQLNETPAQS